MADDRNDDGFHLNAPRQGQTEEGMFPRLFHMVIIFFMISFAQTVLTFLTVVQFVIMLFGNRQPNEQLADFGTTLGIWVAKAARYQTAASEEKPWPWGELD